MTTSQSKKQVFVSYARAESTSFAQELYARLSNDYEVWIDLKKMPDRGLYFSKEIELAIENSEFLLLLLSPTAINSDWVNKEWQYAVECGIRVIPLYHVSFGGGSLSKDLTQIPFPISNWNIIDFQDALYEPRTKAYVKLEQALQQERPKRGHPYEVPDAPSVYIPRSEELRQLTEMMLRNISHPVVITSEQKTAALHGMGGIGKTVLAAAFARHPQTRQMFRDGIFWKELGLDPSVDKVLEFITQIGALLGDDRNKYFSYDIACSRLGEVLAPLNVLIVLDNVWKPLRPEDRDFLQDFKNALGPACRLLVTTRDLYVARRMTTPQQTLEVGTVKDAQAVDYLKQMCGRDDPQFSAIAQRLGGLPLALNLVGKRLQDHMTGREWLETYKQASFIRLGRHPQTSDDSLVICIDLSVNKAFDKEEEALKQLYYTLAVFPEHAWIPERVVLQLWQQIRPDVQRQDLQEIIYALADLALIERKTEERMIHLHDLLHDYNRERLGQSHITTQQQLLLSYNPDDRDWHLVPNDSDGYLYDNIAYHLLKAERPDTLHALLLSMRWLQAKLDATHRISSVIADYDTLLNAYPKQPDSQRDELAKIKVALQLSAHVLAQHTDQLLPQLYGRLMRQQDANIQKLLRDHPSQIWLRPENEYLMPPGTALKHVLSGHTDSIAALGGLAGAEGFISSVAVSANGEVGLTGAFDSTVRTWDITLGRLKETLRGHRLPITGVAISADGKWAVSSSIDNLVLKWDLTNNSVVQICRRSEAGSALAVAINADGMRAAVGYQDGSLVVWNLETGEVQQTCGGHEGAVVAVAMTPDAKWAITGSHDQTVGYWNVETGALIHQFTGHEKPVLSVTLHNREFAISSSADGYLRMWDLSSGQLIRAIPASPTLPIRSVVLDRTGEHAIVGNYVGAIQIWRLADGEKIYEIVGHSRQVMAVALAPDGNTVLSGGCDNLLKIWDLREKAPSPSIFAPGRGIFSLVTHPASDLLVTTAADHSINLWSIKDRSVYRNLRGHSSTVQRLALSHDGRKVASGSFDHTVRVWDTASGEPLHTFKGHDRNVHSVALSPNGRMIAAGYSGANRAKSVITAWSLETGERSMSFVGHENDVVVVAFAPDSQLLLSGSADTTVRVWNALTGEEVLVFRHHTDIVKSVVVSKDGSFAVSAGCDRDIYIWDIKTGQVIRKLTGHKHFIWTVRLNHDDTRLLSTSEDHSVRIWDLRTGSILTSFFGDNVLFSGDFLSDDLIVVGAAASREPYFFTLMRPDSNPSV